MSDPVRELDLAIAHRAAGRIDEAIAHYRAAALGYRDQARVQNAVAVCQSLLELSPEDPVGRVILAALHGPERTSSFEKTPLPPPMPYHVADPTARLRKPEPDPAITIPTFAAVDIDSLDTPYDIAAELETRRRPLIEEAELLAVSRPPPIRIDEDDIVTPVPTDDGVVVRVRDTDEEITRPQQAGDLTNPNQPLTTVSQMILSGALFAGIPAPRRSAVLSRFVKRTVPANAVVIRRGETDHPLVVVGRGELAVRAERPDGRLVTIFEVVAGDHVGEGALLARQPAPVHVIATTETELLLLYPHELYEIAGAFPALWARLKDVAERRAREHATLRLAST